MAINDPAVIKINAKGQALDLALGARVLSFSYEDVEKGDDLLKIVFADPFYRLADSDQFKENTEWTVQWGFPGKLRPARKVLVKKPKSRYGEMEIAGLDKGTTLKSEENWDVIKNKSYKDIITTIAGKYNLVADVADELSSNVLNFFMTGGKTDYQILQYIQTRVEDHFFKIIGDTLFFKRRERNAPPTGVFEWSPGRESRILDYEISVNDQDNAKGAKQTSSVLVTPESFRKLLVTADETNSPVANLGNRRTNDGYTPKFLQSVSNQTLSGGIVAGSSQKSSTGKVLVTPPKTQDEASAMAKSKRNSSLDDTVQGTFEVLAHPDDPPYKSGDIIYVSGIGKKFSGGYRITEITHDLTNGYKYKIKSKRNAVNSTNESGTLPFLNGPLNVKPVLNQVLDFVTQTILGSSSGSVYSATGRRL